MEVRDVRPVRFRLHLWRHLNAMPGLHAPVHRFVRLVPRGGTAVDVGAHAGHYSYWMSFRARQVHAFEPRARAVEDLRALHLRRVTVHQLALSDRSGQAELHVPDGLPTRATIDVGAREGDGTLEQVPIGRLDELGLQDVRFIKVDVEGHELEALKGASGLLERDRPVVFCEAEDRHGPGSVDRVVELMRGFGYGARAWRAGQLLELEDFDLHRDQLDQVPDVNQPNYVNNFLFTHPGGP